jgi:hypothetical protein
MVGKCTTVAVYVHTGENSWTFDSHTFSKTLASCEVFCTAIHQAISPEHSFLSSTTVYVWGVSMYLYDMFLQTSWLVLWQTITNAEALLYPSGWTRWFVLFSFDLHYESFGLCLQQLDLCEWLHSNVLGLKPGQDLKQKQDNFNLEHWILCSMKQCSIYNSLYICIQLCPSAHGACCLSSSQSAFCAFLCLKSGYLVFIHLQAEIQIQLISHGLAQCDSGQANRTHNIFQEQCDDFLGHQENCKSKLVHKMCSGRICVLEKFSCMCIWSVNHFETKDSQECKLNWKKDARVWFVMENLWV